MTIMDDRELDRETRARRRKFIGALAIVVVGAVMVGMGFMFAETRTGDDATAAGVLAGVGFGFVVGGAILAWIMRPGATGWRTETEPLKRDRLQAQRSRQLAIFPIVTLAFLAQSSLAVQNILAGEAGLADYISAPLPVLYAWVIAAIVMGWDHQSRSQKRFLEDELTVVLRARAMAAAFVVLMAGATVAFGVGLWRQDYAIAALPFVLSLAGVTAGVRFAWLDREAGRDDG